MLTRNSTRALAPALVRRGAAPLMPVRGISKTVQSILHGSEKAKAEGEIEIQQHSRLIGRGKYVHGFEVHRVKPDALDEYKAAAEKYYTGIAEDPEAHTKLTGSWETLVGQQDTFYHILEYENYSGWDKTNKHIRSSKHHENYKKILPLLESRSSQLCQEFLYFPTAPPHSQGGIFELRTYQLNPGTMLQWEHAWRQGIEARRKVTEPVGAWFSQIGKLHQVHHMWQYPDLETRKETREKAWQLGGWADTVSTTSQLAKTMDAVILEALPFSRLK